MYAGSGGSSGKRPLVGSSLSDACKPVLRRQAMSPAASYRFRRALPEAHHAAGAGSSVRSCTRIPPVHASLHHPCCLCSDATLSCLRSVYRVVDLDIQSLEQLLPSGPSACSQPTSSLPSEKQFPVLPLKASTNFRCKACERLTASQQAHRRIASPAVETAEAIALRAECSAPWTRSAFSG